MMMRRNHHAVAQAAFAKRGFEVRDPLVAVCRIIASTANRRARLVSLRPVLTDTNVRNLLAAVRDIGNHPSRRV